MRGFPLLQLSILVIVLGVCIIPLRVLTESRAIFRGEDTDTVAPENMELHTVYFRLRFLHVPESCIIRTGGHEIYSGSPPGFDDEYGDTQIPAVSRHEVHVDIVWPEEAGTSVAELELTNEAGDVLSRTVWGSGAVEEILVFNW